MSENIEQQATTQPTNDVGAEPSGQQDGADLNISDLAAIKSIIDVASQRGAFRAAELEAVGKTYNKLNTFLESVTKKEQ